MPGPQTQVPRKRRRSADKSITVADQVLAELDQDTDGSSDGDGYSGVEHYMRSAFSAQETAFRLKNNEVIAPLMQELMVGILHVHEIRCAFRSAGENAKVKEVAETLNLTRPGLYHRIEQLGLKPQVFRGNDLAAIISASERLLKLVQIAEKLNARHEQAMHKI